MARLFVPRERLPSGRATSTLLIDGEDFRYLARVLRLIAGDAVALFDGEGGEIDAKVVRVGPRALELELGSRRRVEESPRPRTTLIIGLMKGDKLEHVLQKATELGVARLVPVRTSRSIVKLDSERAASRGERWDKIAREAARQCGRADVPEVAPVLALRDALAAAPADALRVFFWEERRGQGLAELLPSTPPAEVVAAVGPEGGFTPDEAQAAADAGFALVGLGPRILRAETAAVAALAVLGFALGDLR